MNEHFEGEAIPVLVLSNNSLSPAFEVYFNNEYNATIIKDNNSWSAGNYIDQDFLKVICSKLSPYLTPSLQD